MSERSGRLTLCTSTSGSITFSVSIPTSSGVLSLPRTLPSIALDGRQSKVLVTDFTFGTSSLLVYSTAGIFFAGSIGGRDILFLFGDSSQSHEAAFVEKGSGGVRASNADIKFSTGLKGATTVTIMSGVEGTVTIWESADQLVMFSDTITAATFWAPPLASTTTPSAFENFWQFGTNETVLVGGPYLVRNATLSREGELALRGDLNASVMLTVIAPSKVRSVSWNGVLVDVSSAAKSSGAVKTGHLTLGQSIKSFAPPTLAGWKYMDSLPEVQANFSDADWIVANHTTTNITAPLFGDGRVLYGMFLFQHTYQVDGSHSIARM